jgi:type I restriction enzyme S subunit
MNDVTWKPLREIASVVRGVTFSKRDVETQPLEGFRPVLRAGNIQRELLLERDLVYVPNEKISKNQILRRGDIVMCTSSGSSDLVGKTAYSNRDWEGSFGAFCAGIRADTDVCQPRYLFHYLRSPKFRSWTGKSSGANIKNIRKSELDAFQVPLPSLSEQKRIAKILDKAEGIRRKREQAVSLTDDLLRSAFLEMFGDPSTNPKRWPITSIRELVKEAKYGTSKKADELDGAYPILRMGNITYSGKWDLGDLKYIDLDDHEIAKYTVKKDDILFNRTNSKDLVGKAAVFDREESYAFAGYLVRARVNERADPYYIVGYLNSAHGKATLRATCKSIIGMANINAQEFQNIEIAAPPISLQKEYRAFVDRLKRHFVAALAAESEAKKLFASLSQRAFTGAL